ncbi:hypothetical protein [Ideonella sp.]|uniref:hypothetical protein n=1 Tax=Ideonella sp. TaxID=1929293 RepID=UPI002B480E3D|nr:hypothetical protein [Ideonella sp.]HJV71763.1 hypothetical protein [Ideonella sp.]
MKFVRTCIAVAAMSPMFAMAALSPGQWSVGGIQQICLTGGGTWYGTTFSGWGGAWTPTPVAKNYHIYGNYSGGAGNDSMVIRKKTNTGSWTEWRDDLSFQTVLSPVTLTFVKAVCDPPALAPQGGKANPQQ